MSYRSYWSLHISVTYILIIERLAPFVLIGMLKLILQKWYKQAWIAALIHTIDAILSVAKHENCLEAFTYLYVELTCGLQAGIHVVADMSICNWITRRTNFICILHQNSMTPIVINYQKIAVTLIPNPLAFIILASDFIEETHHHLSTYYITKAQWTICNLLNAHPCQGVNPGLCIY